MNETIFHAVLLFGTTLLVIVDLLGRIYSLEPADVEEEIDEIILDGARLLIVLGGGMKRLFKFCWEGHVLTCWEGYSCVFSHFLLIGSVPSSLLFLNSFNKSLESSSDSPYNSSSCSSNAICCLDFFGL